MFRWRYFDSFETDAGRRARDQKIEKERKKDRDAGRPERTVEQILADLHGVEAPPPMSLPAMEVWSASPRLARDMNGTIFYGEMRQWMDEQRIVSRSQRRMYERLFAATAKARLEIRDLREKKKQEMGNGGFAGAVS